MGLRWTLMPVYWSAMESEGPIEPDGKVPPAWRSLDAFVIEELCGLTLYSPRAPRPQRAFRSGRRVGGDPSAWN